MRDIDLLFLFLFFCFCFFEIEKGSHVLYGVYACNPLVSNPNWFRGTEVFHQTDIDTKMVTKLPKLGTLRFKTSTSTTETFKISAFKGTALY